LPWPYNNCIQDGDPYPSDIYNFMLSIKETYTQK
jgi:hypothetical protein